MFSIAFVLVGFVASCSSRRIQALSGNLTSEREWLIDRTSRKSPKAVVTTLGMHLQGANESSTLLRSLLLALSPVSDTRRNSHSARDVSKGRARFKQSLAMADKVDKSQLKAMGLEDERLLNEARGYKPKGFQDVVFVLQRQVVRQGLGVNIDEVGLQLWPAGLVLADVLSERDLSGQKVLELGCGTGIGAITAAACGADVIATDCHEPCLSLVKANFAINSEIIDARKGDVTAQKLLWGRDDEIAAVETTLKDLTMRKAMAGAGPDGIIDFEAAKKNKFNLIIASDVLYQDRTGGSIPGLQETLKKLVTPGLTEILFVSRMDPSAEEIMPRFVETLRSSLHFDEISDMRRTHRGSSGGYDYSVLNCRYLKKKKRSQIDPESQETIVERAAPKDLDLKSDPDDRPRDFGLDNAEEQKEAEMEQRKSAAPEANDDSQVGSKNGALDYRTLIAAMEQRRKGGTKEDPEGLGLKSDPDRPKGLLASWLHDAEKNAEKLKDSEMEQVKSARPEAIEERVTTRKTLGSYLKDLDDLL